jgi:hypothetical protein
MVCIGERLSHVLTGEDVWGCKWLYFFITIKKKLFNLNLPSFGGGGAAPLHTYSCQDNKVF